MIRLSAEFLFMCAITSAHPTIYINTSSECIVICERNIFNKFKISSLGDTWYSELELNDLGWYVKWRVYSNTHQIGINIRDGSSVTGTNVIAYYSPSQHVIGNLFMIQVDSNDSSYSLQKIRFTTDGGITIQTGWTVCVGNSQVSYTEEYVESDVSEVSVY